MLFLVFFILMFLMWYRLHAEYWRALSGRAELRRAKEAAEEANIAQGAVYSQRQPRVCAHR